MSDETYRNLPDWSEEHIKADVRGTVWCGLRYDVSAARRTNRSGKPECDECRSIANGESPIKTARPIFGLICSNLEEALKARATAGAD